MASWSAVILWMALIFYASGREAADVRVTMFPRWTLEWIYHGAAFGGLAALTYAALRVSLPWRWEAVALLSLGIAIAYGATDEWHQSFSRTRSADIGDVGRDTLGAFVVILLARAASYSGEQILRREWGKMLRVAGGTTAALQGLVVVWLAALWIVAGSSNSFSLGSLRESQFQIAVVREPIAVLAALPFLGVAVWFAWGPSRKTGSAIVVLFATSLSTLVLLMVPFLAFGFNVIPDRASVWVATWIASGLAWAVLGFPLVLRGRAPPNTAG